jgi:hypothetical protein
MNKKKISLIVRNMELLVESLKMELNESESESESEGKIIKFEDLIHQIDDSYEPDYYEQD